MEETRPARRSSGIYDTDFGSNISVGSGASLAGMWFFTCFFFMDIMHSLAVTKDMLRCLLDRVLWKELESQEPLQQALS